MVETENIENGATRDKSLIPKDFLENVLQKQIVDYKSGGGSNPGDNFTSILISLDIEVVGEDKPMHLLFKTFPHHPTRQKLLEDTNLFLKEYLMYSTWIPELIKFQSETVGNDKILQPAVPQLVAGNAINYENAEEVANNANPMLSNFILMVDERKTNGFKMADKTKSLDLHHAKLVLEEVSKLHALGYAYKVHKGLENIRNNFSFYIDPFFRNLKQKPTLDMMINSNVTLIKDALHEFLELNPHLSGGLDKYSGGEVFDLLYMFLDPEGMDEEKVESMLRFKPKEYAGKPPLKDQWIVAGHGDCWTNNMIFKYDEMGKVTDTILVDLQITRESCMMADIVYFIYTSTDTAFRKKHLHEVLRWYFEKFEEYCSVLKVDPFPGFTWENFQRKFHRSKIFGFLFALLVLPIILSDPESSVDLDTIEINEGELKEEEEFAKMFSESSANDARKKDRLNERFTAMLMELHEEGVL